MAILDCAMCHNFEPSLISIIDDGDQYFVSKKIVSKNVYPSTCHILTNEWQLMTLTWCHGYNYNEVAWHLKMNCFDSVAIEL